MKHVIQASRNCILQCMLPAGLSARLMLALCACGISVTADIPNARAADTPVSAGPGAPTPDEQERIETLFAPENLLAWCIVPFDGRNRGPAERVEMLVNLGFGGFAYDWRTEHLPSFDKEIGLLQKHGISLDGVWLFYTGIDKTTRQILDTLSKNHVSTDIWVLIPEPPGDTDAQRVSAAAEQLRPLVEEAGRIDCRIGLYNHGGWFGEPENQIAIIDQLEMDNVGIVYNFHHGHAHIDRLDSLLETMLPYLYCININGMVRQVDPGASKILPLGIGEADLYMLKAITDSGYEGRIGILGHTQDDAEMRLRDNLEGLAWLLGLLRCDPPIPRPEPRTYRKP